MLKGIGWGGVLLLLVGCGSAPNETFVQRSTHSLCGDCGIYACDERNGTCYDWCRDEIECAPGIGCNGEHCIFPDELPNESDGPCGLYAATDGSCYENCRNDTMCSAGAYCYQSSICKRNHCIGKSVDDGKMCTLDSCAPATGVVTNEPYAAGTGCSDGNLCNGSESCDGAGQCAAGVAVNTYDGNPCTEDSCNPLTGVVTHTASLVGTSCSDNNACTGVKTCDGTGQCVVDPPIPVMDDGNSCTTDICDPATGNVLHSVLPDGFPCTIDNLCLIDICHSGTCQTGPPAAVEDGNVCTLDTCTATQGVIHHECSALDRTVSTVLADAAVFLYSGIVPIQTGVGGATIDPVTVAVVRGHVYDHLGAPLPGVSVVVVDHPEFGATITQGNGGFDMAVNGGQALRLRFTLPRYLPAERTIQAPLQDYVTVSDVALVEPDMQVTSLDLSGSQSDTQVARGSTSSDGLSTRRATLFVPAGTLATMALPDGSTASLVAMQFRATDYTAAGPNALPGTLPSAMGQAYAVELSSDEAQAAGATEVDFSQSLPFYVENFLGLPVGAQIPHGFYSASLGSWVPASNGVVVKIISVTEHEAKLDIDGDETADTGSALTALGITDQERAHLAGLYSTGQVLWRVPIAHFSSHGFGWDDGPEQPAAGCAPPVCHDPLGTAVPCKTALHSQSCEWPCSEHSPCPYTHGTLEFAGCGQPAPEPADCWFVCCPPYYSLQRDPGEGLGSGTCTIGDTPSKCDDPPPPPPSSPTGDGPGGCEQPNASTIRCQRQSLGEDLAIAGTPYALHYESDRQRGRRAELNIPLTSANPPPGLLGLNVEVSIAGRVFKQTFGSSANQTLTYTWDGADAYGRLLQGAQPIAVLTNNQFRGVYRDSQAFGLVGNGALLANSVASRPYTISKTWTGVIGNWDAQPLGLGGWSLDALDVYDISGRALRLGNGDNQTLIDIPPVIQTIAGTGGPGAASGDGGAATSAVVSSPAAIAIGGDSSIYISDGHSCVRRVDKAGMIHSFAGQCGSAGFSGDGGAATSAQLHNPNDLSIGPDGSLYIADTLNQRVRRVGMSGVIQTVAGSGPTGTGSGSFTGDGGSALRATFQSPSGVDVGADGIIYIADTGNNRIRTVAPDGVVRTVAGNGGATSSGSYGPAIGAGLASPSRVRVGLDGSFFVVEQSANVVRRVGRDGLIYGFAGAPPLQGYRGDGGDSRSALLHGPTDIALRTDGALAIVDQNNTVRLVAPNGTIFTLAGVAGNATYSGDNGLAASATFGSTQGVRFAPDGSLLMACTADNRVRRVGAALVAFSGGSNVFKFPSADGRELKAFDAHGRHIQTLNALTGAALLTFGYDSAGRLGLITDADGRVTHFNHDPNGVPTTIVGPFGQTTTLAVNENGYLKSVTDPAGGVTAFTYEAYGLMATKTDANYGLSQYFYDSFGRLSEDDDAAGGSKKLIRTDSQSGFTVTSTSALDKSSSFTTATTAGSNFSRFNTAPTGLTTSFQFTPAGVTTSVMPDGTLTTTKQIPDPRYGMLAPSLSVTTTLPPPGPSIASPVLTQTVSRSTTQSGNSLATFTEITNLNGNAWSRTFNVATRTWTSTSPLGRQTTLVVDGAGRPTNFAVPGVSARATMFDDYGRLSSVTQGARSQSFSYFQTRGNANGYLQTVTDALSQSTTYTRDAFGRELSETVNGVDVTGLGWDLLGNLTSVTPPTNHEHQLSYTAVNLVGAYEPPALTSAASPDTTYDYDLDRNLTTVTRPDGMVLVYSYDIFGRPVTVTSVNNTNTTTSTATITNSYFGASCTTTGCAPGRVSNIRSSADDVSLDFQYDGSLLSHAQWSGGASGAISWIFNNDFRIKQEGVIGASASANPQIFYGYDSDGLLTCASATTCSPASADAMTLTWSLSNGFLSGSSLRTVTDSLTYNSFGEPATESASSGPTALYSETYDDSVAHHRDALGRILRKTETLQGSTTPTDYTYDARGRLHTVTGSQTTTYEYDANGNRLSAATPTQTLTATYDNQDRLVTYGTYTYTYTTNGELKTKTNGADGGVTKYEYDAFGNLTHVTLPSNDTIDYLVDGKNRRVGKKKNGTLIKAWVYRDQLHPEAELDGSFNVQKQFVYASGKNTPDYLVESGVEYRILSDQLGSPRLVVNAASGAVTQRMRHDEFGNVLEDTNQGYTPFGFAGGLYDPDTGLVRFGARDYDPVVGRWIGKDPILFNGGQANLYVYVGNDPVNRTDPNGLESVGDWLIDNVIAPVQDSWDAASSAQKLFGQPNGGEDGPGDAYRHCLASCTLTQRYGTTVPQFLGWFHEHNPHDRDPNPAATSMDDSNNACGRDFGDDPDTDCTLRCASAATHGQLTTLE